MLTVLLVDDVLDRRESVRQALVAEGYTVVASLESTFELRAHVERLRPDAILIDTDAPDRDTLEGLAGIHRDLPRPVLMFSHDDAADTIRAAMAAGVAVYVADGFAPARLAPLMKVAQARFEAHQEVCRERDAATRKLADRVAVERAKGVLMKIHGTDEESAYGMLRKTAMDQKRRLADVARELLNSVRLLG
ncbi:MAG: ANTAR domain-containing protein [Rhodocyclaceae bacterium]|nr:ANTAR domain-containing protein [Rhodocyclaceae bacterium]MCB1963417.1 ANTAR domain-containing protein [Rhodocyclaceae bacterium]